MTCKDAFTFLGNEKKSESLYKMDGFNEETINKEIQYPLINANLDFIKQTTIQKENIGQLIFRYRLSYCPVCIQNHYHSTIHQIAFFEYCPFHPHIKLLQHCPKCNREYLYALKDEGFDQPYQCKCGHEYSNKKNRRNPKLIIPRNKIILKWVATIHQIDLTFDKVILFSQNQQNTNIDFKFHYNVDDIVNSVNKNGTIISTYKENTKSLLNSMNNDRTYYSLKERKNINFHQRSIMNIYNNIRVIEHELYKQCHFIFKAIARHIRKKIKKKHKKCLSQFKKNGTINNIDHCCPITIAYCLWRSRFYDFLNLFHADNCRVGRFSIDNYEKYGFPISEFRLLVDRIFIKLFKKINITGKPLLFWQMHRIISEILYAEFKGILTNTYKLFQQNQVCYERLFSYQTDLVLILLIPKSKENTNYFYKRQLASLEKLLEDRNC